MPRNTVAKAYGVDVQTVCARVHACNSGGVEALKDEQRPGRPRKLNDDPIEQFKGWLDEAPGEDDECPSGTAIKVLCRKVEAEFGVACSEDGLWKRVRKLGYRKLSPRPIHARTDEAAWQAFREDFGEIVKGLVPEGTDTDRIEVGFPDVSRIGMKGMLSRAGARKGTRPRLVRDQGFTCGYLLSVVGMATGETVGHVCDRVNPAEMNLHLEQISQAFSEGHHAVVVLDGAGWHKARALVVPDKVTLCILPACSSGLNPVETIFENLKVRYLSNRKFETAAILVETVKTCRAPFRQLKAR